MDLSSTLSTAYSVGLSRTLSEYARQGLVRSTLTEVGIPTACVAAHNLSVGAATTLVHCACQCPFSQGTVPQRPALH